MTYVELLDTPLEPESLRRRCESPLKGGVVVFCGEVRSVTGDETTEFLEYEAYVEMAVKQMEKIAEEAASRWEAHVAVSHRTGRLIPGEVAVVCVAACAHRAEAFECCRFLIDRVKADVPIWKK